jgi:glycine reductase
MQVIAGLLPRLVAGDEIEDREGAGLYGSSARRARVADRVAADRAVDMLLEMLTGEEVGTELAVPDFDPVTPPAPVGLLAGATVALVTEGGLVPKGNPDGLTTGWSERWASYRVADLLGDPASFEAIHGGYDTRFVNESPYRLVPADVVSELVDEGVIGALHPRYYVTAGMATPVLNARKMGSEIAAVLRNEGVDAVIFTST